MVHANAFAVAATALLAALPVQAGLYPKSSAVLQVDGKNYDRLIAQSNYTSIVEFYAPWCGHCKNLQPAYEKAAKSLAGLAKVAAVDCDEEFNKPFCGSMGVQGFPTLKIVKPGKTAGKPIVEDYNGPRTAKGIVDYVVDKIPNHVKRVDDKTLEAWLAEANDTAKAILFTDKGKTSALLKSVAIEFKGAISVAQIRNTDKEKASLELFGISKFPTLLLLPGGKEAEGIPYTGEMNKASIVEFLTKSTSISPNADPAPAKVKLPKESKSKDSKKASKDKAEFEKSSSSQAKEEGSTAGATATDETIIDNATPSPDPIVESEKPVVLPPAPMIPALTTDEELFNACLSPKTGTCILLLLSRDPSTATAGSMAINSLSEIAHRHKLHKRNIFPFYILPETVYGYVKIRKALGLERDTEMIAINARRGWWRRLPVEGSVLVENEVAETEVERWVDQIRLGEGTKMDLPEGLVTEEAPKPDMKGMPEEPVTFEFEEVKDGEKVEPEPVKEDAPEPEPVVEPKVEDVHDEL